MGKKQGKSGTIQFADYRKTLGVELVYGNEVTHEFTRHTHRTLGLGIVEQGLRLYWCQDKSYHVKHGQIFIIPPNCEHGCGSVGGPHSYRLLLIADQALQASGLIREQANYAFAQLVINDQGLYARLRELHGKLTGDESDFVKKSFMLAVVGDIFEEYAQTPPARLEFNPDIEQAVRKVQSYIEENYSAGFLLEDIAQLAHISPYHLLRQFSRIVGIPPHIYQQQVRIRQAKQLLSQGCSILDTAMNTGFADQSHFSKVFKKLVGITPREYR
ncbi:MAG: AraC family transcriptional regulator [Firmicutes bacterium]|nr:AraC family transcriptional regulator [Bacillota bacterium]